MLITRVLLNLLFILSLSTPWLFLTSSSCFLVAQSWGGQGEVSYFPDPYGDLKPLAEARPLLEKVVSFLNSHEVLTASAKFKTIELLRKRLITSLFHLSL